MIYLDSAATTLEKPAAVSNAVAAAIRTAASPGRGGYRAAQHASGIIFRCRELAAELFGVSNPEQVILTCNATHGLNIAIRTLVKPGMRVVISGYEHNAVTRVLHGIPNIQVRVVRGALFDREAMLRGFEAELHSDADVAICNHVSNVFGYILPVEQIAGVCKDCEKPLIVDASQSAGVIPISMSQTGAAFIAMPGHKGLYGPQGTGLLLCGTQTQPLLFGGTGSASIQQSMPEFLPDRLEAGTQNVCGAAGLLAGLEFVKRTGIQTIGSHERDLCRNMCHLLRKLPSLTVFSGEEQSGVLSFAADGIDCELIGERLARRDIAVRAGLHCAPLAHETAGTLESGTVRVSFSVFNSTRQVQQAYGEIRKIVQEEIQIK